MITRQMQINTWLSGLLPTAFTVHPIQADASSRKYYRVQTTNASYIVMDTEPGAALLNFIQIDEALSAHISVPQIIQRDLNAGLLLLSDFGGDTYLNILQQADPQRIDSLYTNALHTLHKMQQVEMNLLPMHREYIADRLEVFTTWYLQRHLKIAINPSLLQNLIELFTENFARQKQAFVHLDYHSRNLMVLANDQPGVLDFQDAMYGPITYDLVSLLQDAYITWPRARVEAWIAEFAQIAQIEFGPKLLRDFDLVGLQRHLKNLGVFARLNYRDSKAHYLPHIPTLLQYITSTCERYPELTPLHEFLTASKVVVD